MKTKEYCLTESGDGYFQLEVLDAMDQYAKEVAIEFAWWMIDHRLDFQAATPDQFYIGVNMQKYNSHELFEQFKAEKGL